MFDERNLARLDETERYTVSTALRQDTEEVSVGVEVPIRGTRTAASCRIRCFEVDGFSTPRSNGRAVVFGQLAGALPLLAVLAALWLAATVLCAPALLSTPVYRLFDGWPTRVVAGNYALSVAGLVGAQVVGVVACATLLGGAGSNGALVAFLGSVGAVVLVWLGVAVGLPATDRWAPTDGGWDGRLVLAGAAVWCVVAGTLSPQCSSS